MVAKVNDIRLNPYSKKIGSFFKKEALSYFGIGEFAYAEKIKKMDPADIKQLATFFFPKAPERHSLKPARYFAKGIWENNKQRYPITIEYLLSESTEEETYYKAGYIKKKMETIPLKGILRKTSFGLIYLDIENDIVHQLLPLIPEKVEKPPYFSLFNPPRGAHSPVIIPSETSKKKINPRFLVGQEIRFNIKGLCSIEPDSWNEVDKVYMVTIESEDLENLREKFHLAPRIGGNDFHIVIAIVPTKSKDLEKALPTMRINPASLWI